ncbi:TetR family transcriptional regulator [Microbacterium sp. 2FI]|uniref:TetR/AcrR family transcriptional regulator n=1 Tax=Microbacterium sp. 2FI TaxID=2502193 RepID=UPI0010F72B1D|nr:TetR family transcriptional regulator [Microbacterium sp. 2FI]
MASTRDRALDAALALVGEEGIRSLTHARVDERAGLPKGSTSNWFRTRDALVTGLVAWMAESERADMAGGDAPAIETPEQFIDALSALIAVQTGPFATRTRARYALFLEGSHSPELLAPLLQQRAIYVEWTTALLAGIGVPSPAAAVRTLMAAGDGLVLHRVTIDPEAEIRPVIDRVVRACLDD